MFLDINKFLSAHGKDTKAYDYHYTRIGYQRGAAIDNWRRIIATIIEEDNFCSDTINYIVQPKDLDLFAILSFLNSSLWEWRFRLSSTNNHVNAYEIDTMPIPAIAFTTPAKERKERVSEAIELYGKFMVDPKKGQSYGDLDTWVEAELKANRDDTIHDFIAYLAEQMIELNKAKNVEIRGFLKWFGHEIKSEIDDLTNKTAIKDYHEYTFDQLLDVLKKNKNKITVNPADRKFQEWFDQNFTKSISVLSPLKAKISATDGLIDDIVYKLYGLTDEEIGM